MRHLHTYPPRTRIAFILVVLCVACNTTSETTDPVAELIDSGTMVVLTRNSPTTYYEGRDEEWEGFEYELVTSFADWLGVAVRFETLDNTAQILQAIREGRGQVAAAGLTRTPVREREFLFGPDYMEVTQQVVCGSEQVPRTAYGLRDLSISVIADSSYEERLKQLAQVYPHISWTSVYEDETEQIMDRVWQGELDCTVADSNIVEINRRYFPELRVAFSISPRESLAWIIAPGYEDLRPLMDQWLQDPEQQWLLDDLKERYFGYVRIFDYVDIKRFHRNIEKRLPLYEQTFKAASERYQVSWTLLAAQAYQESLWNPKARSPTGVRGLMMLTQKTSAQLGVIDRLDPEQSIMGGARYFRQLSDRLPESIKAPDRDWFALAAYNVGFGHVLDARRLARQQGLNPDSWRDLKEVLPLLAKPAYYKKLRHGYARGREPVRYVQRIRDFHDMLIRRLDERQISLKAGE